MVGGRRGAKRRQEGIRRRRRYRQREEEKSDEEEERRRRRERLDKYTERGRKSRKVETKENGKICFCVNYRKLNSLTVTNAFPLLFTDGVLDTIVDYEMYSFLDGLSCYNKIHMHPNA